MQLIVPLHLLNYSVHCSIYILNIKAGETFLAIFPCCSTFDTLASYTLQ